jgi:hypothetical protein
VHRDNFRDRLRRVITAEIAMLAMLSVGLVLLAVQAFDTKLPGYVSGILFIVGTGMVAIASGRIGGTYFSEQRTRHGRAMAKVAFRRSLSLYAFLERAEEDVRQGHGRLLDGKDAVGRVRFSVVETELSRIAVRLNDGRMTLDDALAEWEEIIPEDAHDFVAQLAEES